MTEILCVVLLLCLSCLFGRIEGGCDKCGSLLECRGLTQEEAKFVPPMGDGVFEVRFTGGDLSVIWPNFFDAFDEVKSAILVNNSIGIIGDDSFANLKQLEELDLSLNKIQILRRRLFRANANLQWISLRRNQISHIESGTFSRVKKLTFIDLSDNDLKALPSYLFYNNVKLLSVNLSNNKLRRLEDNIIRLGLIPVSINLYDGNQQVIVPEVLRNFVTQQNTSTQGDTIDKSGRSDAAQHFVKNVVQNQKRETKYIFMNSLSIVEAIVLVNASITTCLFLYGVYNVVMLFYRDTEKKAISKKEIGRSILRRTYLKRKT